MTSLKRKKRFRIGVAVLVCFLGCSTIKSERQEEVMEQIFAPTWQVNQQWKIRMNIPSGLEPKSTSQHPILESIVLLFQVVDRPNNEGDETVIFVREEGAPPNRGYRLYIRKNPISLRQLMRVTANVEKLEFQNDIRISYRPQMNASDYVWDFPVFPISTREKVKTGLLYHGIEILETVNYEEGTWVVIWEIPSDIVAFETIQRWQPGKPWFIKAERYQINPETNERILYSSAELME